MAIHLGAVGLFKGAPTDEIGTASPASLLDFIPARLVEKHPHHRNISLSAQRL